MLEDCLEKPLYGPKLKVSVANIQLSNVAPSGRSGVDQEEQINSQESFDTEGVMSEDIRL